MVDAGHDVLEVAATPIAAIPNDEVIAIAGGSPNIRIEHGVARGGEELVPRVELIAPVAGRAAVHVHDRRQARAARRSEQRGLDLPAVEAPVLDQRGLDEREVLE